MTFSGQQKRWILAIGYVLFIYATLGVTGIPLAFLRAHGVLRLSLLACYLICLYASLHYLIVTHTTEAWRYVLLLGAYSAALLIAKHVKLPEEQVHFFEYGLVAIFYA